MNKQYRMMVLGGSLFLALLAGFVSFKNVSPTKVISPEQLSRIYSNGANPPLGRAYRGNCIYSGIPIDTNKVVVAGGHFRGGVNALLNYTRILGAIISFENIPSDSFRRSPRGSIDIKKVFERFAGQELFDYGAKEGWEGVEFRHYKPAYLKWLMDNMIPDPSLKIGREATAQNYYDDVYQRFFRLMAESYMYLKYKEEISIETVMYLDALNEDPDLGAPIYLKQTYGGVLQEYGKDYGGDCALYPDLAIGFWLRRHANGNDQLVWQGFEKICRDYDAEWFEEMQIRYYP